MPINSKLHLLKSELAPETDFVLDCSVNGRVWFSLGKKIGGDVIFAHIYDRDLLVEFTFRSIGTTSFIRSPLVTDRTKLSLICPTLFKEANRYRVKPILNKFYFTPS